MGDVYIRIVFIRSVDRIKRGRVCIDVYGIGDEGQVNYIKGLGFAARKVGIPANRPQIYPQDTF